MHICASSAYGVFSAYMKFAINSKSTGKFVKKLINGRDHIVTSMISVVADTVMNRLRYPFSEVVNSFQQLNALPAPAAHPVVDGQNVSAFHPLAINAFHVGGMVANPRMEGGKVINDLIFDIEVANKDDRGKEIIKRIENGEKIGVSTGLNADKDTEAGILNGEEFDSSLSNMQWDHVAILLDEAPAGSETFTINSDITICNLAESVRELEEKVHIAVRARFGDNSWPADTLFDPDRIIVNKEDGTLISISFSYNDQNDIVLTGEEVPVVRKVTYPPIAQTSTLNSQEVDTMDHEKLVLALIANTLTPYVEADQSRLMQMSETGIAADLATHFTNSAEVTIDEATAVINKAGLHVNKIEPEMAESMTADAEGFKTYKEANAEKRKALEATVLKNSKLTQAQLDKMDDDTLVNTASSITPAQDYSLQGVTSLSAVNSGGGDFKLADGA